MVLVAGATGNLGGVITRMLLAQGKSVRVLVRSGSAYQPLVEAGAQPIFGDLKDRASLDPACAGVDVIISTANSALRGGDDNPLTVDLEGNRNLVDAAKDAGVKQFIFVSASMADATSPVPFVQAKGKTEEYLKQSGLAYTILAPDAFLEVWVGMIVGAPVMNGQPVTVIGKEVHRHTFISAADVAAFAVAAVDNPAAFNQRLLMGGPQALSWEDCVAAYERLLGRSIVLNRVNPGEPVPGLEDPNIVGMLTGLGMSDSNYPTEELARSLGVKLTTLDGALQRMMAAAPR